jgi:hypothetical protein
VGKRSLIRFREKGGKEIPVHHKLEEYLDAAKLSEQPARSPKSDGR